MIGRMEAATQGMIIAVEGIDGAGKTTQVQLLRDALIAAGESVVCSKEPTDGHWGQLIRKSATNGRMSLDDELQAFVEDRKEHVAKIIRPALERGQIVILDRYYFSTIAYQGARGADVARLTRDMRQIAPAPDAVILMDIEPAIAVHRIAGSRGETPNTFERVDSLSEARGIFLGLGQSDPTIHVIDAHESIQTVYRNIVQRLLATALKAKRCAKSYDCEVFYCSFLENGTCKWANLYSRLSGGALATAAK